MNTFSQSISANGSRLPLTSPVQITTLPTIKFYQTTTFKICVMAGLTVGLIAGSTILLATPAGLAFAAAAIMQLKLLALLLLKVTASVMSNHLLPAATKILLFCTAHPIISAAIVFGLMSAVALISLVNEACVYMCKKNLLRIFTDKFFPKKSKSSHLTNVDFQLAVNMCGLDPELAKRAGKQKPGDADYDEARRCFVL